MSTTNDESADMDISIDVPTNDIRFQMELEFIQCLASPAYLHCALISTDLQRSSLPDLRNDIVLATNRFFENEAFLNYLEYLSYWKRPEYAKYLMYVPVHAIIE